MLHNGVHAYIKTDSYEIPPVFGMLAKDGDISRDAMYNTYNMGLGMVLALDGNQAGQAMEAIRAAGETPYIVGHVEAGEIGVVLC